ncbi:MAG: glycosyltransferase family 4 protein [Thermomicrobiales bacterium]|nr:glycosyltransferase family 4 protein [Thermomicrobiales bacterium]
MPNHQTDHSTFVRAGIDTTPLTFPPSGIRTYAEALLTHLSESDSGVEPVRVDPAAAFSRRLPGKASRFWWDAVGTGLRRGEKIDLLHLLHGSAPAHSSVPVVVTLHDLIPLTDPAYRQSPGMRLYQSVMERTLNKATAVIVPSAFVAGAARQRWGWPTERLHVIPMAVGDNYAPASEAGALPRELERIGVRRPYIFNVGGFDARKNLPLLIEAFAQFRDAVGEPYQLVIAGAPHSANERVFPPLPPVVERHGLEKDLLLPGFVSEATKIALFQHAAVYVTPSRSEGFGMTCLEAMACGAPVIAANRTSLPEVTGNAALLVEPETDPLCQAMIDLTSNPEQRQLLRSRGIQRAAEFSWSRTASMTAEVYRSVSG